MFIEASLHFIPFFIGTCTKDEVVFIQLVFLGVVLFQTFKRVGGTMKEAVIPVVLAVHVVMVVNAVMVDDSVMEAVEEEVADILTDVALADELKEYTVFPACQVLQKEALDEGAVEIPVDVPLADEPERYIVPPACWILWMEVVKEEVADIPTDVALGDKPEGMIHDFVTGAVDLDLEVTDLPVEVALGDEPEEYMVVEAVDED
ncbi:hypothetical protein EDD18DRAFT_1111547 [Armillaria luteobubalina]|uniref:Uncharacterized protein n=1 Tax=Armillaria luteobubalina TaxID=153913 RepID=A0AA39PJJ7_9AGAR|nr:hypothetical protein EDD18DRAFT_1111547 [Armillaria luteobubalina]